VNTVSDAEPDDVAAAKGLTNEAIDNVIDSVESSKDRAAARAVSEIADDDVLLTHDFSSTVLAAIDDAIEAGHSFEVYVTESRPRFLGRKMTRHLSDRDGVDVTLIVDSAAGHFMPEVDRVLVGMDCIVDDTLYNRIGTYPIATAAADNDVPVTVVGAAAKYVDGAFAFENEIRPLSEVLREPADGFEVANPAYDATPTHLLDTVVTDDGVHEY
jgi:translation initiation factor eIF-2B subunit delta